MESFLVECVEDQAADLVVIGVNQRSPDNFREREIGEPALGADSLFFRTRRDACQLVARLLLVGFGEQLSKIGENKTFGHGASQRGQISLRMKISINNGRRKAACLGDPRRLKV